MRSVRIGVMLACALVGAGVGGARAQGTQPSGATPPAGVSAPAPGQEAGRARTLLRDFGLGFRGTVHTLAGPTRWSTREWLALPAAAAGLVALSRADEPVKHAFDRNHSATAGGVLDAIEPFGAQAGIGVVVATYAAGLVFDRAGLRRAGVEAAVSSVVASGIVTPGLKLMVGRARPRQGEGAYAFHGFSGDESFPSGHTTQAFAAASVFAAEAHPTWAKVLIYGAAGGVATARLYHDAHFLTDVAAGAAIGTLTGRAAVAWGHGRSGGPRLAPYAAGDRVGVTLSF